MAIVNTAALKGYFNAGDEPTEANFVDVFDSLLNLTDGGTVAGATTFTLTPTLTAGVIGAKVITQTGTAAEDLTSTAVDTIWVAATTQAGNITLPQATVANAGMTIKILCAADWASTAVKLGFANGGSTVMFGMLNVAANNAQDAVETFPITNNSKILALDADDVTGAGGAKGSQYTFTYISANLVHCEAHAKVTTGTVAPDAASTSATGI